MQLEMIKVMSLLGFSLHNTIWRETIKSQQPKIQIVSNVTRTLIITVVTKGSLCNLKSNIFRILTITNMLTNYLQKLNI